MLLCARRMRMCLSCINRRMCQLRWRHRRRRDGCHDNGGGRGLFRGRSVGRCDDSRSDMSPAPGALFCLADDQNQRLRGGPRFYEGRSPTPTSPRLRLQLTGCRGRFPVCISSASDDSDGRQCQATVDAQVNRVISVNADKTGLGRRRRHWSDVTSIQ